MDEYNLENLKLITRGGEADIYEFSENKIIRVLRRYDRKTFDMEKTLFSLLHANNIKVPRIYEYTIADGRPAEIMQKISGGSMLNQLKHNPLVLSMPKTFAKMHAQILNIEADSTLPSIEDIFNYFITKSQFMEAELIGFVSKLFAEIPHKNNLCHGDFHPGNILIQDSTYYIIDWLGAYRSDYLSDIAHTYLLVKHVPEIPGESKAQHTVTSILGSLLAKKYLNEVYKLKNFDFNLFSKWTVIMSFLRANYGLPSEKGKRIEYINKCYYLSKKQVNSASWYKNI